TIAVAGWMAAAGCAPGEPEPPAGGTDAGPVGSAAGSDSPLASSLNVQVDGDSVRFALMVSNASGSPEVLEFTSAQRMDFVVETMDGEPVWQWSAGNAFAQVMGSDTLSAGGSRAYEVTWSPGGRRGRHIAIGRVTSSNTPIEL